MKGIFQSVSSEVVRHVPGLGGGRWFSSSLLFCFGTWRGLRANKCGCPCSLMSVYYDDPTTTTKERVEADSCRVAAGVSLLECDKEVEKVALFCSNC